MTPIVLTIVKYLSSSIWICPQCPFACIISYDPDDRRPLPNEWTVVIDGSDLDRQPYWAPSGDLIYFLSKRDGSRCIWAQRRIDKSTRLPIGPAFAAHHMHQIRYNLDNIPDPAAIGLSLASGHMFYASFELQSNIWLAERRQTAPR